MSVAASLSFCISSRLPLAYHSRVASTAASATDCQQGSCVEPPSIRDTTTDYFLSNTTTTLPCLLFNSLAGSFAANHPWETRCTWEIVDSWHEFDTYNPDPDPTCHSAGLLAITL